ncbi:MAG: hypothetical protein SVY53_10715 [Chloroflexota bacterium]|nr:hypothetical protein [Chloroflexota bacterium]
MQGTERENCEKSDDCEANGLVMTHQEQEMLDEYPWPGCSDLEKSIDLDTSKTKALLRPEIEADAMKDGGGGWEYEL